MTVAAGDRLGPYEILGPLGSGGLGDVYRARDPRLGRDVAIKVLPREVADDADRLRRFEQEARALAVAESSQCSGGARCRSRRRCVHITLSLAFHSSS